MKRIYDQPDHPAYGPVRRLHIMVLQLFADRRQASVDDAYAEEFNTTWDQSLAQLMSWDPREAANSRAILERLFSLSAI